MISNTTSNYTCDYCMTEGWNGKYFPTTMKIINYNTADNLVEHVRTTHPERWPAMLPYIPGDIHNKTWQPQEIQAVRDLYLEIRATQGVGTQLVITYDKDKNIVDANWTNYPDKPESDMSVHARAMNKASATLNRSPKTIRDILNGRFGNPIILEKTGNGVGKTQLTDYASNVIRQIQETNWWSPEPEDDRPDDENVPEEGDRPDDGGDGHDDQERALLTSTDELDNLLIVEQLDPPIDTQLPLPKFDITDDTINEWVDSTSAILTKVRELQHVQKEIQIRNEKIQSMEELIEQLNTQVSELTEELSSLKNFYLIQTPRNTSTLSELSQKLTELTTQVNDELSR